MILDDETVEEIENELKVFALADWAIHGRIADRLIQILHLMVKLEQKVDNNYHMLRNG